MEQMTPDEFWERAGLIGYGQALFRSKRIERHVIEKQWDNVINASAFLGLNKSHRVLELGCGDGEFSAAVLSQKFISVDAYDKSFSAIERAKKFNRPNINYAACDIIDHCYTAGEFWDAAFLIGFLHHVKSAAPKIIESLSFVTDKVIILEPNGDNPIRKILETLPSYKSAGEESFKLNELMHIFSDNGFDLKYRKRINFFAPIMPDFIYHPIRIFEILIENNRILEPFCSTNILGFERKIINKNNL